MKIRRPGCGWQYQPPLAVSSLIYASQCPIQMMTFFYVCPIRTEIRKHCFEMGGCHKTSCRRVSRLVSENSVLCIEDRFKRKQREHSRCKIMAARTRVMAMGLAFQEVNSVGRVNQLRRVPPGGSLGCQVTDADALTQRNSPTKCQCLSITGNI